MLKKKKSLTGALTSVIYPVIFGALIIILWQTQVLHKILGTDTITLPFPSRIIHIIIQNSSSIMTQTQLTLKVSLGGLLFGTLFGFLIAIIAVLFQHWGISGLTVVSAFNAIPLVALAPVINNWTRNASPDVSTRSTLAKIIVVTIFCTASMSVNAYRGLRELKPFSEDLMKSYGVNKFVILIKLRFPNCLPYLFTALRISVPASVIGAIVSEYFAEETVGVGRQIRENIVKGQYPTAWAYITVACAIGITLYVILLVIEAIVLRKRKG